MAERKEITTRAKRTVQAYCDVYEEEGNIVLRLEMPGVSKENLDIKIEANELTIHGGRKSMDEKTNYLMKEIYDGDFMQKYVLDETIDRNKIHAALEKGVLTLKLGIKDSEKPRKIQVVEK